MDSGGSREPSDEIPIDVVEEPADARAAAIWDRAFVAEEKAPGMRAWPPAATLGEPQERGLPTVVFRTGGDAPAPRRRLRAVTALLVAFAVTVGAGGAVLGFQRLRARQTTAALLQAVERARSDTMDANSASIHALEALHRSVPDRPDVLDALAEGGGLYALRFDPTGPVRARTASLARSAGTSAGLLVARAVDMLLRGDAAHADQIATAGLETDPPSPALAYVRARARLATAQTDAAIQDLVWAEGLVPDWPAPLALRVDAERLAGRLVDARESLEDLRSLAPGSSELPVVEALVDVDAALLAPSPQALATARRRVDDVQRRLDGRARILAARLRLAAARLELAQGQPAAALETLRALRATLPGSPELVRVFAQVQSAAGDPEAAMQTLQASAPQDREATWIRAQVLLQLERPEAARAALEPPGAEPRPDRARLVEGLSAHMMLDATTAAARLGAVDLAGAGPLSDDAALAWIEALSETAEWSEVRAAVQRLGTHPARPCARALLLAMFANERGAREGLTAALGEVHTGATPLACIARLQGHLSLAAGDAEAAVLHLERAARGGNPSDSVALARALWRHGGAAAALEPARRALSLEPTAPRVLFPLVELLASLHARAEMLRAAALATEPSMQAALLARGLRLGGEPEAAAAALGDAGDAPIVQLERALLALQQGDAATAADAAQAARDVPPLLRVEAQHTLVRALVAAGRAREADGVLEAALEQAQRHGQRQVVFRLRLLRAALAIDRGDPASLRQAEVDVDFARSQMSVGSAEPIVLAAALAAARGERSDAVRLYHQALAHDPTRRDAFEALLALGEAGEVDRTLFGRSWPAGAPGSAQTR